ncbi:hypothetical protein HY949_00095 [Candidatus Gottesmanbacteria bacterium]|nr:hypothetical protein [Candidatus Gottesmanbacteria bacterium]
MKKFVFKKLRTITFLQLIILLIVSASTVGIVKFFGKKSEWRTVKIQVVGKDWSNLPVSYNGYRPPYWLAESIQKNDVERSVGGGIIAEVIDVERYSRSGPEYDIYLTVRVNGVLNKKTNKYIYKGKAIEIGAPIDLRLNRTLVFGQIIDDQVPPGGYVTKRIIVTSLYRNASRWIINNLKVGDTMTTGSNGSAIAEIVGFTTEPTGGRLLYADSVGSENVLLERDPTLLDAHIRTKLLVEKHDGEWFFGGHQSIKVGNFLWLNFPKINAKNMEIESVEEITANEKPQ